MEDNSRRPEITNSKDFCEMLVFIVEIVKKTVEDEEKKTDPTLMKYYSYQHQGQVADKSNGNVQKENKPMNIAPNEVMLAKSLNKEEKEEQLKNLLFDYQDLAKHKHKPESQKHNQDNEEEENFEEDESNRVYARYLYSDILSNVNFILDSLLLMEKRFLVAEKKTQFHIGKQEDFLYVNLVRIEALRVYLEKQIGEEPFYETYKILQDMSGGEETNNELVKVLGKTNMKYIPLIYQMIVCEDSYYGSN